MGTIGGEGLNNNTKMEKSKNTNLEDEKDNASPDDKEASGDELPAISRRIGSVFMMDKIKEADFLKESKTGDILLFTTNRIVSRALRIATNSKYDHVAMIIRNLLPHEADKVHVFEAVGGAGVRIVEWDQLKQVIGEE